MKYNKELRIRRTVLPDKKTYMLIYGITRQLGQQLTVQHAERSKRTNDAAVNYTTELHCMILHCMIIHCYALDFKSRNAGL